MSELYVGVDIGGTKVATAIVDVNGRIIHRSSAPSQGSDEPVIKRVWNAMTECVSGAGVTWEAITAVGLGAPGPVDPGRGLWWGSVNLHVADPPMRLAQEIERRCGRPAYVENDVKAGGIGELHFGHGRHVGGPADSFLFISVGTGLGACLVAGGKLFRGRQDAGEIGHIPVDPGGHPCACGHRGCLETVASGRALIRWARDIVEARWSPRLAELCGGDLSRIDGSHVLQAAGEGDEAAEALVRRLARGIALAVVAGYRAYDPSVVILGGGVVIRGGDYVLDRVNQELRSLSPIYSNEMQILVTQLGYDAGVLGAAAVALSGSAG